MIGDQIEHRLLRLLEAPLGPFPPLPNVINLTATGRKADMKRTSQE
jgi:hypothetical protein